MFETTTTDTPAPSLASVEAALGAVLAALDPATVSGSDAHEALGRFGRIANMAAHGARLMGKRVDETSVWKNRGHRSAADSVAEALGCSTSEAARELGTARKVADRGATDAAARRGELSPAKASDIVSASAVDPDAEDDLLDLAKKGSAAEVRDESRRRRHAAAGDDRQRHRRIRRNRSLRQWIDDEGAARLLWNDVPEHGAEVGAILEPYIDQRFHQARRAGRREHRDRYAADAFLDALRDAAAFRRGESLDPRDATAPTPPTSPPGPGPVAARCDPERPTDPATVVSSADPAMPEPGDATPPGLPADPPERVNDPRVPGQPGDPPTAPRAIHPSAHQPAPARPRLAAPPDPDEGVSPPVAGDAPLPAPTGWRTPARRGADAKVIVRIDHSALLRGHTEAGEVCEVAGLGPVPVSSVAELMDDAFLAAVIVDGQDVCTVAHLGRAPNAYQRTAIQAQAQRCTTLGCPRTARLELDHADPWVDTHETRVDRLDPSCEHCHDLKTYEGHRHPPGTGPRPLLSPAQQAEWNREHPDRPIAPLAPPGRRGPRGPARRPSSMPEPASRAGPLLEEEQEPLFGETG